MIIETSVIIEALKHSNAGYRIKINSIHAHGIGTVVLYTIENKRDGEIYHRVAIFEEGGFAKYDFTVPRI